MSNPERALLLDTHVWLWLMSSGGDIRPSAIRAAEEAATMAWSGVGRIGPGSCDA